MPNASNQTTSSIDEKKTNNWVDNLLIKDELGKLSYLKPKKEGAATELATVKELQAKSAPANDSFAPIQQIKGSAQTPAEFAFHPQDKEDLDEIAKTLPQDDSKKYSIEKIVDKLVATQNFKFDEANKNLFVDALYNFFRDRKNAVATREFLASKILSDKKKLSIAQLDTILSVVKGIKEKVNSVGGLVIRASEMPALVTKLDSEPKDDKQEVETIVLDEGDDQAPEEEIAAALKELGQEEEPNVPVITEVEDKKEEKAPKIEVKEKTDKVDTKDKEIKPKLEDKKKEEDKKDSKAAKKEIPPKPSVVKEKFDLPPLKQSKQSTDEEKPTLGPKHVDSLPKVMRPSSTPTPKKQVVDVVSKAPAKDTISTAKSGISTPAKSTHEALTGPVKELQTFSISNFRRLGSSAKERVDKILDKINLLEQDSFTKKAQGIEAWRQSPVYQAYLQLGADSMTEGKQIEELITDQEQAGQDTLSMEEFSAISDLNKLLRF